MGFVPEFSRSIDGSNQKFFDLVDQWEMIQSVQDCRSALNDLVSYYGLTNAAYLGVNLPGTPRSQRFGIVTYSTEWVTRYLHKDYFQIDPVIPSAMNSLLPFDWSSVDRNNPEFRDFFGEASEFKVGHQGLSIPIRGRMGEMALFSVSNNMKEHDWKSFRRYFLRDFQILAFYFHEAVLRSEASFTEYEIKLSRREVECLSWAAAGKTFGEIATILSLSERTVKFYLDIARVKLRSTNITQAVSKASIMKLIRSY